MASRVGDGGGTGGVLARFPAVVARGWGADVTREQAERFLLELRRYSDVDAIEYVMDRVGQLQDQSYRNGGKEGERFAFLTIAEFAQREAGSRGDP